MIKCKLCFSKNISFFTKRDNYTYYLCNQCDVLFIFPLPLSKQITTYYKKNFTNSAKYEESRIRKNSKNIIEQLIKLNPKGKRILDIGSGHGYFLDECLKKNLQCLGIEPSKNLRAISSKTYKLKIINKTLQEYANLKTTDKFDFITLIHVLEHVENPKKFIILALKLLKNNGVLYIETPNLKSRLFHSERENYTFLTPPDHLWVFSKKSIINFLKLINSSLIIRKSNTYSFPEHLSGIIKNTFAVLNYKRSEVNLVKNKLFTYQKMTRSQKIKYLIFDVLIFPIFTPLLNINESGSFLRLFITQNK